nr:MAG: capsid protein [Smacoviridae sp.]
MTTQFARASYQEIIDLHTESDTVSVIGIHTPQGDTPRKMFGGFFDQFKKFKYLGCSVSLVPAARLPADPLQVSYEAGDTTIDPRDMLNPLMFHGCHGNDMGVILNRFYNTNSVADQLQTDSMFQYADSFTDVTEGDHISGLQLEDLYYKALTDNTWKKAHPQRGFKKGGLRPLVYSMATNMQFNGSSIGMGGFGVPMDMVDDVSVSDQSITATFPVSQAGRRFFTPRLTGLGWLDTRNVLTTATTVNGSTADLPALFNDAALNQQDASEADLPLVYMGMILLPPAYKTEQYFRMIINHHFAFKDFRGISFSNNLIEPPAYNQFNDPDEKYYPDVDEPVPPEPVPVETRTIALSISGNSDTPRLYAVGYKMNPDDEYTIIEQPTPSMSGAGAAIYVLDLPVGAYVGGTYSKVLLDGSTAYGNIDTLTIMRGNNSVTAGGVTYYSVADNRTVLSEDVHPTPLVIGWYTS